MKDTLKPIPMFPGYFCSEAGDVYSTRMGKKPTKLQPGTSSSGYLRVLLKQETKYKNMSVHRLVLLAFQGPPSEGRGDVNHIDGVKTNNTLQNLEWCSRSDNMKHAFKHGLNKALRGESNGMALLTETDVSVILGLDQLNYPGNQIAKIFNVTRPTIYAILKGNTWNESGKEIIRWKHT